MTSLAKAVAEARADAAAMKQVLLDLELVSHGRTMRGPVMNVSHGGSHDPSAILAVDKERYPHELHRARWNAARTPKARSAVLAEAREHLQRLRKAPPPPEHLLERGTHQWRLRIASDSDTPIGELARLHGVSRQSIRAWRKKYGLL